MPHSRTYDEQCIKVLLKHLGKEHIQYVNVLTLQERLRKNCEDTAVFGDSPNLRSEWAQIQKSLNQIALDATRKSLDELYIPSNEDQGNALNNPELVTLPTHQDCAKNTITLPCCPFVAGPKITDPRLFVGRKAELHRLVSAMESAQPISVNLIGERRIGKSSLLYHLFQTWEQRVREPHRYVVAYLSFQDAAAQKEKDFYHAVARALLARHRVKSRPTLVTAFTRQNWTRVDFANAMHLCQAEHILPVLCLDEFEALFQYPEQFDDGFYDALRALMDDSAVMLIVISHKPLDVYRRRQRLTSSFFNLGQMLQLGQLTEDEAIDLVRLPAGTMTGTQAALSLDEQKLARDWAGRHPFLLQLAGSALCQARQGGKDITWARKYYQTEAHRLSRQRTTWPRLLMPLKWLVWNAPLHLGQLAKNVGIIVDELTAWVIGIVIILVVLLAVFGILDNTQLIQMLYQALGG